MKRTSFILAGLVALGLAAGCTGSGHARVTYTSSVTAESPDLVYVEPGVYAVANYSEPVFYSGGSYWLYRGGFWYRSGYYTGGWSRSYQPPVVVSRIHNPHMYVRFRATGRVYRHDRSGRVYVRDRTVRRPVYRDHRRRY